jgi:hypothetical protein
MTKWPHINWGGEQGSVTLFYFLSLFFCAPFLSVSFFNSFSFIFISCFLSFYLLILLHYHPLILFCLPLFIVFSNAVPLSYPIPLRFPHTSGNLTAIMLIPLEAKLCDQLSGHVIRVHWKFGNGTQKRLLLYESSQTRYAGDAMLFLYTLKQVSQFWKGTSNHCLATTGTKWKSAILIRSTSLLLVSMAECELHAVNIHSRNM